ncbi:MAG: hypothetical protein BJ554DRAFT_225 [Olpidium bornovanus]|uniref:Uncharacterized protein n=1 Tax=Olpidium bornovanus TaxID=278681 RepID=A0A8H7ZU71_9FUNG|nr:MAG: hypothetical protein BJ554DRAFT_225 [Olpidium bornovanus]
MRLAASLLALVAAAPALVSAAPSRNGVSQSAAPSPGDDADPRGFWRNFLVDAIKDHIGLAGLTLKFIAKEFEHPPPPESCQFRTAGIVTIPAPGEVVVYDEFLYDPEGSASRVPDPFLDSDDRDDDFLSSVSAHDKCYFDRLKDLLQFENVQDGDVENLRIERGFLKFKEKHFEIYPKGRRAHFLSENTRSRPKKLWKFYCAIWTFLNPRAAAQDSRCSSVWTFLGSRTAPRSSPPVPDIFRSVDSDRPNLKAEFTIDAVRDFLDSVADELSRTVHENFDAQNSHVDVADWLKRLRVLDKAISSIHLYDDEPFLAHGKALRDLQVLLDTDGGRPVTEASFREQRAFIRGAANAAERAYSYGSKFWNSEYLLASNSRD